MPINKQVNKLLHGLAMEHYMAVKMNDLELYALTLTNLRCLLLSRKGKLQRLQVLNHFYNVK